MKIPYLTESAIELATEKLIARFERKYGCIEEHCVPLDEIAECVLDLDVRCENLKSIYGELTLGAIYFNTREIRIDDTLNDELYPAKRGRYRFTLAHEIGHWMLHEPIYRAANLQTNLFESTMGEPSIICRAPLPRTTKKPIEWQADYFASCLTMPRTRVIRAFEIVTGSRAPYCAARELAALNSRTSFSDQPLLQVSRETAALLETSIQAMQIKLINLGLVTTAEPFAQLLDADAIAASYCVPDLQPAAAVEF